MGFRILERIGKSSKHYETRNIDDALFQKTYTVDFLTKKIKKSEGELLQVYVENARDVIIDKKAFDLVQIEKERRKSIKHYCGISIFSGKIYCGECGAFFGRKVWHSNDKYRTEVYRCNEKYNGKTCNSGHIIEDEMRKIFVDSYNKLPKRKTIEDAEYINTLKMSMRSLTSFDEGLFAVLLDKMIVNKDKVLVVWRDGSVMEVLK